MNHNQLPYHAILEGFNHGVLIVTQQNHLVYANSQAQKICQQLAPSAGSMSALPSLVWDVCECLIAAQAEYKGKRVIIDHTISPEEKATIRITARWLDLEIPEDRVQESPHVLVILESSVLPDSNVIWAVPRGYGFTPREAEVWSLARAGKTYRQIAEQLFISINTVKRHMKNALAKEHGSDYLAG